MNFITFIDWLGRLSTVLVIVATISAIIAWVKGIWPVLLRLGNGLAMRKIAVFAKPDNIQSVKHTLLDSKLFSERNIIEVTSGGDMGRAENATVLLVFWQDWSERIDDILQLKADGVPLIVYAPQELGLLPSTVIKKLNERRNSTLVNFRGRLMNDIVISMITTSYEKR